MAGIPLGPNRILWTSLRGPYPLPICFERRPMRNPAFRNSVFRNRSLNFFIGGPVARKAAVSDKEIRETCDRLIRRGEASVAMVRQELGGGSTERIAKILSARREELPEESRIKVTVETPKGPADTQLSIEVSEALHGLHVAIGDSEAEIRRTENNRYRLLEEGLMREHAARNQAMEARLQEETDRVSELVMELGEAKVRIVDLEDMVAQNGTATERREKSWERERLKWERERLKKDAQIENLRDALSTQTAALAARTAELKALKQSNLTAEELVSRIKEMMPAKE